jgi:SPOR domain
MRLALFRADDDRFTDEEILTILRAGEAGLKLDDVCAAGGIRVDTYQDWKARFGGLMPADVRNRRLRERWKRRATMAAIAVLAVLSVGAAGMLVVIRNKPALPTASLTIPLPAPSLQGAVAAERPLPPPSAVLKPAQAPDTVPPSDHRASGSWVSAEDIAAADPSGYIVQVAAVPTLQEARAVLAQLAEAGYPAYLTAKIVDRVELYRVRVGPLKSRPAAEEVARRLEREGHRAPWVTN